MDGAVRMLIQPAADLGLLGRRIIVEGGVDGIVSGQFGFDDVGELDELLMSMALHVAAYHRAVEDIECCEQGGGAVAFLIVRHGRPDAEISTGFG